LSNSLKTTIDAMFDGREQANSGGHYPPDITLAVGANYAVQMVNSAIQITDKAGNLLRTSTLNDFFNIPDLRASCNPCDPIVLYDNSSGRYFASVMNKPLGTINIAASQTSDPTIPWKTFSFSINPVSTDCFDQPYIAVSSDKLAVGTNVYSNHCDKPNRNLGTQHIIVNKADLISTNGPDTPQFFTSIRDPSGFSERPVKSFGTTSDIILASVGTGFDSDHIKMIKYSGQVPNIHSSVENIPIRTLKYPPPVNQPVLNLPLDTTGRLQSASMSKDGSIIWMTSMTKCNNDEQNSCIRLIQFNPNTKQVLQDFDFAIRNLGLLYPALTITSGNDMVLGFGVSSSNVFPSFAITSQSQGDSPNTLEKPVLVKAGQTHTKSCGDVTCRYGDYFGSAISPDPVNAHKAWLSGEYTLAPSIWGTFITSASIK